MKKFVDYLEAVRERTPEEIDRIIGSANNRNLESAKNLLKRIVKGGLDEEGLKNLKESNEVKKLLETSGLDDSKIESLRKGPKEKLIEAFLDAVNKSKDEKLLQSIIDL